MERDADFTIKIYSEPVREQIDVPLREQLIVELYSK
jgi:ribosomal protein S4